MGCCFVPLTITAVAGVHHHDTGLASALLNTGQQLGGAVGLSLLGTIGAHAATHRAGQLAARGHGAAMTKSMSDDIFTYAQSHAFAGGAVLAGLALVASITLVRVVHLPRPVVAATANESGSAGDRDAQSLA